MFSRVFSNDFVDALVMMIAASCVILILALVFFPWLVKIILGADMGAPVQIPARVCSDAVRGREVANREYAREV